MPLKVSGARGIRSTGGLQVKQAQFRMFALEYVLGPVTFFEPISKLDSTLKKDCGPYPKNVNPGPSSVKTIQGIKPYGKLPCSGINLTLLIKHLEVINSKNKIKLDLI